MIHNNAKSNKLTDQVFWYKAEPHDNVRLGSKQFWDFNQEELNQAGSEQQEEYGKPTSSKYVVHKKY